jgi:hypothetical protein
MNYKIETKLNRIMKRNMKNYWIKLKALNKKIIWKVRNIFNTSNNCKMKISK